MKSFFRTRKGIALLAAGAIAVVAAVAGYAFFTASGSGTGTITVGTASSVQLSNDPVAGIVPGGTPSSVTVHVHNPSAGTQYVGAITGAVRSDGDCLGSWFAITPSAAVGSIAPGGTVDTTVGVAMTETGTSQDPCQGKPLTVDWSTGGGSGGGGSGGGGSSGDGTGGGGTGGGGTGTTYVGSCPGSLPNAGVVCTGGTVTYTCNHNFADVDGNPANGCEVNLSTDAHNCGAIGRDITGLPHVALATCVNGVANITCSTGWVNADGNPLNGCETALASFAPAGASRPAPERWA
jgi:hypothetical protein